jgi:hypothetical protein
MAIFTPKAVGRFGVSPEDVGHALEITALHQPEQGG